MYIRFCQQQQTLSKFCRQFSMKAKMVFRSVLENENRKKTKKKFQTFFSFFHEMHQSNGNSRVQGDLLGKKQYAIFSSLSSNYRPSTNCLQSLFSNLVLYKVNRSKGRTLFIAYVQPSKNKLDRLRKIAFVYMYLRFSIKPSHPIKKLFVLISIQQNSAIP